MRIENIEPALREALCQRLLASADDELVLGHRNSEWTGHAPILEEDIAFSNIAQDEMGHALIWYSLLSDLTGQDPDQLVFFRSVEAYRNVQMVELPKGDWAFSMLRQFIFDSYELVHLSMLMTSKYLPMAEAATKIHQEELYHYRHSSSWIKRLGLGTGESHNRLQNALDQLWAYSAQLFVPLEEETYLHKAGYVPDREILRLEWQVFVIPYLKESGLSIPSDATGLAEPRSEHSQHLVELLNDMQDIARSDPSAQW